MSERTFRCTVCGYLHRGAAPPVHCPVCGVEASFFELLAAPPPSTTRRDGPRLLILGGGVAGLRAAETASSVDATAQITLLSAEEGLPYLRLDLTRLLAGEARREELPLTEVARLGEEGIEVEHGEATRVLPDRHEVHLRDGRVLAYDRLVLATGAHAFAPPVRGASRRGVFTLRSLGDALRILEYARACRAAVVIGGGLLGLESAWALARQGLHVTLIEGAPALLPRQLAPRASELLAEHLRAEGLDLRCGASVEALVGDEAVSGVRLATLELPADLVLFATGVQPNVELARRAGLHVNRGVVVDDRLITSDPDILAAGDVAEHAGRNHGLWSVASTQGEVAGANAAGASRIWPHELPSTRLKVLDVEVFSVGDFNTPDCSFVEVEGEGLYQRLALRGGRIVGANLFGDVRPAARIRAVLTSGEPLDSEGARRILEHP